jgi:hypothetical protein
MRNRENRITKNQEFKTRGSWTYQISRIQNEQYPWSWWWWWSYEDIRENIFRELKKLRKFYENFEKVLMREWIGFFFVLWNENWHWWVVMCS